MKLRKIKGQVSMEYVTIVGFVMVLLIPLLVMFYQFKAEATDSIVSNQVYQVGKKIIDSAETIYFLGEPSKTVLRVYLPEKVSSISFIDRELVFNVSTRAGVDQIVFLSDVNVTGTLTADSGLKVIEIESRGTYVEISDS